MMAGASTTWMQAMKQIYAQGERIGPRGMQTLEILGRVTTLDMLWPVMEYKPRKLSKKFMAAEAHWILTGSSRVEDIAPYCKEISKFSDSGYVFQGAYGPRVIEQMHYIVQTLKKDPASRQAVIEVWRPMPRESKDIPCTVAMQFLIRDNFMHCNVFMRSSDAWLGLPYDMFNFTCIATAIALQVDNVTSLGVLKIFAGSAHLYERDFPAIVPCICEYEESALSPSGAWRLSNFRNYQHLISHLDYVRKNPQESIYEPNINT